MSGKARKLAAAARRVAARSARRVRDVPQAGPQALGRGSRAAPGAGAGSAIVRSARMTPTKERAFAAKHQPAPALGEEQPRDDRPDRAREVELERVQGHGVRDPLLRHEARDHRLVGGGRLGLHEPGREGDEHDRGDAEVPGQVEHAQQHRHRHLEPLRREQDEPAVDAVGHRSPEQHEGEERHLLGEAAQAQVEGVAEAGVDDPGQRHVLDPGADAGEEGARPQQAEAAVGEGRQEAGQRARLARAELPSSSGARTSSRSSSRRRSRPACAPSAPSPCGGGGGGSPSVSRSFVLLFSSPWRRARARPPSGSPRPGPG